MSEENIEKISFGSILKNERLKKSLSLEEISADIKINLRLLRNLENSNLEELPKRAFTKGLIKSYATYLEIPLQEVLTIYNSNFESNTHSVTTGVLKNSDNLSPVFISDVFQKTIMPISVLLVTVAGVFVISTFLKKYNPSTTFNNTTNITIEKTQKKEEITNNDVIETKPESVVKETVQANQSNEAASITANAKVNTLTVEPLDKTAILIKTNLDTDAVRASLKPNKTRIFKFESAEVTYLDAGAVNLLFNGKDIGVPGNFGEQKIVNYPQATTE